MSTHVGGDLAPLLVGRLRAPSARSASSRATPPRLEPVEPHLARRLDHDHRVVARRTPVLDSTSSGTSWTTIASGGAAVDLPQELLADRRVRDRLEVLARPPRSRRPSAPARPGRGDRRREDVRPEPLDELRRAPGVPGSTTSRAIASASTISAPRSASRPATVDLPEPIPPVRPPATWCGRCYRRDSAASGARAASCSLRVRVFVPGLELNAGIVPDEVVATAARSPAPQRRPARLGIGRPRVRHRTIDRPRLGTEHPALRRPRRCRRGARRRRARAARGLPRLARPVRPGTTIPSSRTSP